MFKKYLNIILESKYNYDYEDEITDLINKLDDDLIEELKSFDDFGDLDNNASIELKQIIYPIININKDKNGFYFKQNSFENLKKFILFHPNIKLINLNDEE